MALQATNNAAFTSGRVQVGGGIELAYDLFGSPKGKPLVLVMGIGAQRIFWQDDLCTQFADAGFHVARFDHRDIGESTLLDVPVPHPNLNLVRRMLGMRVDAPYTLSHMAGDVAGLIDKLDLGSAHIVGASLGGMVGQHLAIEYPTRVRSLTSIMSTPGGRRYFPERRAIKALFARRPTTREEAGDHVERLFKAIGSPVWPIDSERLRTIGTLAYDRGMSPRGFMRHFAAVLASGDRKTKLRTCSVPTLVIHGSCDPMFPLRAGRDMTRLLPNATWLPISGMGHDLPPQLWPMMVRAIARHADRAESR